MSGAGFARETHYRASRQRPVIVVVSLAGGTVLAATAFVETRESLAFRLGIFAVALAFVAHGLFRGVKEGLHTDGDGVRLHRAFGSQRFAWHEIEAFRVVPRHPLPRIELATVDGRRVRVPAISQGPMEWDGGRTRDAAGRLNAHLAWARASSGWEISRQPDR